MRSLKRLLFFLCVLFAPGPSASAQDHPADLNDDDEVDAADLAMLLGAWGPCL